MTYGILFEKMDPADGLPGSYYAHVPELGLTTHGEGVEGARASAVDLIGLWLAEKQATGEPLAPPVEFLFSTVEVPADALQNA